MVERALQSLTEADVVLWVIDASDGLDGRRPRVAARLPRGPQAGDRRAQQDRRGGRRRRCCRASPRSPRWCPTARSCRSARARGENVDELLRDHRRRAAGGPRYYPADELTDEPERAIVAEIVREKVMLETRDEIPYAIAVSVDAFEEKPEKQLVVIKATIHVARDSQKPIVIGERGARIKAIGQAARRRHRGAARHARLPRALRARADRGNWTARSPRALRDLAAT